MYQIRNDQVTLAAVLQVVWQKKWWLLLSLCFSASVAVFYCLQLPNVYRSEARMVAAAEMQGKSGGLASQLSGVSALAGISLGGGGEKKSVIALETMRSRQFFAAFAAKHQLLTPIVAAYKWDPQTDKLLLDPEMIDQDTGRWIRPKVELRGTEPSMQEGFDAFMRRFGTSQDKLTGVVTISFEFISPKLSQRWLSLYIEELNELMRQQDIKEAQSAINYINTQIEQTKLAEVKSLLFSLVEDHTKTLTMANARKDYIFKMIDPPFLPEVKSGPYRSLIVLLTLFIHCFVVLIFIMLYLLFFAQKPAKPSKGIE